RSRSLRSVGHRAAVGLLAAAVAAVRVPAQAQATAEHVAVVAPQLIEPHGPRDVLELPALDRSAELAAHPRLVRGLIARDPVEEREEGDNVVLAELEAGRTERVDGHVLARRSARVFVLRIASSGVLPGAPIARVARGV